MEIKFFGGASQVTGSAFMLDTGMSKILIDCGMEQGQFISRANIINKIDMMPKLDCCILTHAHIDHTGLVPLLIKKNKTARIISTPATKELSNLLLYDFARLQQEETFEMPLYSEKDIEEAFVYWEEKDDGETFDINSDIITFYNNSHILGSVSVLIETANGNFLFSGDIGTESQQLMDYPPDVPDVPVDYLFLESTYGDKTHENKSIDRTRIVDVAGKVCKNGGKTLIPAFSVGRLQEVLYTFSRSDFKYPIYVDSPMGEKITQLIDGYRLYLKKKFQKLSIDDNLFTNYEIIKSRAQSVEFAEGGEPSVIISASGMMEGGRILNHYKTIKDDKKSAIFFVGYQSAGTRGSRILSGNEIVLCKVEKFSSFSAHADKKELISYVTRLPVLPYKTYLVHGEDKQRQALASELRRMKIRVETPVNFSTDNMLMQQITKSVMLNFNYKSDVHQFDNYKITPFAGFVVEREDKITIEDKSWFDKIFNDNEIQIKSSIGNTVDETSITEIKEVQRTLVLSDIEIKENIQKLFGGDNVLSKNRLRDFWEAYLVGKTNALKFVQDTHFKNPNTGKRRWNAPAGKNEEEAEQLYELAYNTLIASTSLEKNTLYNILTNFGVKI